MANLRSIWILIIVMLMIVLSCNKDEEGLNSPNTEIIENQSIGEQDQDYSDKLSKNKGTTLEEIDMSLDDIQKYFFNSNEVKKVEKYLSDQGADIYWDDASVIDISEGLAYFPIINSEEVIALLGVLGKKKKYQFKITERKDLRKEVTKELKKPSKDPGLIPMEVIAYTKADHENFPGRVEILWQLYLDQYIAMAPEKKNKCRDIYQCGYSINETYNWGFTGDAAGTGGYYHYYGSSYTYEYRCIWLYTTCGSTIQYYDGGITTGSSSSSSSTSTTTYDDNIVDETTTPCVQSVISKVKNGQFGNDLFVQTLRDIFDISTDVNIVIKEADLANKTDAEFISGSVTGSADHGLFYMDGEIRINSDHTSTASKDWILATIIHEMIHGYITYQRERVRTGYMSEAEFAQRFPLWYVGSDDHLTMGYQYVQSMADILQRANPNLSRYEALSLSRVGLHDTSFWNFALTDMERQDASYFNDIGRGTKTDSSSKQIKC